jgi:hypothetical protein
MLNNLKLLLGIDETDEQQDKLLQLIINNTTARLQTLIGGTNPPTELNHIILDVAVIRFNKIGSEGFASHTVEGESMGFVDDDFLCFEKEIQAFLKKQEGSKQGKVRFL